jgi:hypothetical protein
VRGVVRRAAVGAVLTVSGFGIVFSAPPGGIGNIYMTAGPLLVAAGVSSVVPTLVAARARAAATKTSRAFGISRDQHVINVGGLSIQGMSIECMCDGTEDLDEVVKLDFPKKLSSRRKLSPEVDLLKNNLLPALRAEAESRAVGFYDDEALDLLQYVPIAERARDGAPIMRLAIGPTSYFEFAVSSNSLDRNLQEIAPELGSPSLRSHWKEFDPRSMRDVQKLPAPAKIGVVTAVVTADGFLALLERGQVFQVPSVNFRALHCVAEGATPRDVRDGYITPRQTAVRSLREELDLRQDDIVRLRLTGLFLDHQRWQVVFTLLAHISLTAVELNQIARVASHRHETDSLAFFAFGDVAGDLRELLLGGNEEFRTASNHAEAAIVAAMSSEHGFMATADALR